MTNVLYGAFYQSAAASLDYIKWLGPHQDNTMPRVPSAHPSGVVLDHQLFTERRDLARHLNTRYCASLATHDGELVPDTLGIPLTAPTPSDRPWLACWHRQAERSVISPFCPPYEPGEHGHALRAPNVAAAVAAIGRAPANDADMPPYTVFVPARFCLISFSYFMDTWFLASHDHWDDEVPALRLYNEADPTENLYALLASLPTGGVGFSERAKRIEINAAPPVSA